MVSPLLLEPTHVLAAQLREREALIRDITATRAHTTPRRGAAHRALTVAFSGAATALAAAVAGLRANGTRATTELCCAV